MGRKGRADADVCRCADGRNPSAGQAVMKIARLFRYFLAAGTPTALEIPMLAQLMQAIRESFRVTADAELTTEANPGTLSYEMAAALKKMGFNRLSMGVQAWAEFHSAQAGQNTHDRGISGKLSCGAAGWL